MLSPQSDSSFTLDIFDDFDEPNIMEATFCRQVSEQQYQEEIKLETDKALGELCFYLDKNPAAYARVLRKRKQEDIENSGMFSYFKSKMKSFVQGEKYQEELVSSIDCIQHVEALKAGICKTFQYSQELKGNATRHSERLAAKRKAQPLAASSESNKRRRVNQSKSDARSCADKAPPSGDSLLMKDSQCPTPLDETASSETREHNDQCLGTPQAQSTTEDAQSNSDSLYTKDERAAQLDSLEAGQKSHCKDLGIGDSVSLALPPPPPPLPANLKDCFVPCQRLSFGTPLQTVTNTPAPKPFNFLDDLSVHKLRLRHRDFSPRSKSMPKSDPIPMSRSTVSLYGSVENLSAESPDAQFVTPTEGTSAPRCNKRFRSSKSSTSTPKSAIQLEILSFSSMKRLKATQVDRSPGLTPLRAKSDIMPSEPLQRALHTAMKRRFKNLTTPSPKSFNSSNNSSFDSVYSSP